MSSGVIATDVLGRQRPTFSGVIATDVFGRQRPTFSGVIATDVFGRPWDRRFREALI